MKRTCYVLALLGFTLIMACEKGADLQSPRKEKPTVTAPIALTPKEEAPSAPKKPTLKEAPKKKVLKETFDQELFKKRKAVAKPGSAEALWLSLGNTKDMCSGLFPWWADYWPDGGIVAVACHVMSNPTFTPLIKKHGVAKALMTALGKASPHPIYKKSKKQPSWGEVDNHGLFAHYDPEFVKWFAQAAIPAAKDEELRKLTQPYYDKFFKHQAMVFEEAYLRIKERKACYSKEKKAYLAAVRKKEKFDREHWTMWQADNFCDGIKWGEDKYSKGRDKIGPNLTRDALGFWMRRDVDGTMALWYEGLRRLRDTYERKAKNP